VKGGGGASIYKPELFWPGTGTDRNVPRSNEVRSKTTGLKKEKLRAAIRGKKSETNFPSKKPSKRNGKMCSWDEPETRKGGKKVIGERSLLGNKNIEGET